VAESGKDKSHNQRCFWVSLVYDPSIQLPSKVWLLCLQWLRVTRKGDNHDDLEIQLDASDPVSFSLSKESLGLRQLVCVLIVPGVHLLLCIRVCCR
jgi:hypothetical protein